MTFKRVTIDGKGISDDPVVAAMLVKVRVIDMNSNYLIGGDIPTFMADELKQFDATWSGEFKTHSPDYIDFNSEEGYMMFVMKWG